MDTDSAIAAAREATKSVMASLSKANSKLTDAYGKKPSPQPTYFVWPSAAKPATVRAPNPSAYPPSEYSSAYVQHSGTDKAVPTIKLDNSSATIPIYEKYKTSKGWASEYDAAFVEDGGEEVVSAPSGMVAPDHTDKPPFFAWGLEPEAPGEAPVEVAAPKGGEEDAAPAASVAAADAPEPAEASEYDCAFHWWSGEDIAANKGRSAREATVKLQDAPMGLNTADDATTWQSVSHQDTECMKVPEVAANPDEEALAAGKPLHAKGATNPSNFAWDGVPASDGPATTDYKAAFTDFGINKIPTKFVPKDEGVQPEATEQDAWCSEYDASFLAKKKKKKAVQKAVTIAPDVVEEPAAVEESAAVEECVPEPTAVSEPEPAVVVEELQQVSPAKQYTRTPPKELVTPVLMDKPRRSQMPAAPTSSENSKIISSAPHTSEYRGTFAWPSENTKPSKAKCANNQSNFSGSGCAFNQDLPAKVAVPIRTLENVNAARTLKRVLGNVSSSAVGAVDYHTSKLDMTSKADTIKAHKPKPVPCPVYPSGDRAYRARPSPNKPRANLSLSSNPVLTNRTYPTTSDRGAGRWTSESRSSYAWKKAPTSLKAI